MTKTFRMALAAAALLSLAACSSGPELAPTGKFAQGAHGVTLDRNWSAYPADSRTKTRMLTVDGVLLNRLYVSDGLSPSDPLFIDPIRGDTQTNPAPRGKADMSLSEQMEYVATALSVLDYQKVETSNPKPVTVGTAKGVRFEFTAKTTEGLNIKGLAQAVSKNKLNYYIIYVAPAEHYYDAGVKNAAAAMDSEQLP
jgi:hypothetical protein